MRIKTQIVSLGKMSVLVEHNDEGFTSFQSNEEWSPRLALLPTKVAEVVHTLLLDGFVGTLAEAVSTAERLVVSSDGQN
jgi:hypothetical protein